MSYFVNGPPMMHAAVNTDTLLIDVNQDDKPEPSYRLKERNIPHIKVPNGKELRLWYDFGEKIGQGGFGVVLAVMEKKTGKKWAMKTVSKVLSNESRLKMLQREILILKLLTHPHVIYLDKVFETTNKIYMVFERCYGELSKLYHERKPFVEKVARILVRQLVEVVAYLHKYDIVHRDLKLENILLGANPSDPSDEYYIKLTDFGLSIVKHGQGIDSMLHDYCGTIFYMAPEIITARSYSQQCDVWAIGIILYMMVTGNYPFYAQPEKALHDKICAKDPDFSNNKLSREVTDLIMLLLKKDPANRLTAAEALNHPWLLDTKLKKTGPMNILQMMKEWKSEMTVTYIEDSQAAHDACDVPKAGKESDWVAPDTNIQEMGKKGKTPLQMPKTNINFERGRRGSNVSKQTIGSRLQKDGATAASPSAAQDKKKNLVKNTNSKK